jgi:hypothetical protein
LVIVAIPTGVPVAVDLGDDARWIDADAETDLRTDAIGHADVRSVRVLDDYPSVAGCST